MANAVLLKIFISMQVMLKTMLDDERISYQGLMEKILEDKGQVPIALTLAVIRVFLNIPCVMHKPYIKTKGSRSAKRTFAMKHWYPKRRTNTVRAKVTCCTLLSMA